MATQIAYNMTTGPAEARAKALMQSGQADYIGTRPTCILMWSMADHSLWRGLSDNKKLVRLARSMIAAGFKQDEPIRSRTFDLRSDNGILADHLLLGDGQARGLSARLAWQTLLAHFRANPDLIGEPMSMHIMQSLLMIPSVFERTGQGSHEDLMVAQVVRQNAKATYCLPMNTLDWVGMILKTRGLKLGQSGINRQAILACMMRCTTKYHSSVEVDAYDMQPMAKRPRRGRKSAQQQARAALSANDPADTARVEEADEDRLKIGNARTRAITNVPTHCTLKSDESLEMHMVWVGDWSLSCFNDKILELPWIWKGSLLDEGSQSDDVVLLARDVAACANEHLIAQGGNNEADEVRGAPNRGPA